MNGDRPKTDQERLTELESWVEFRGDPMHAKVEGLMAWQKWLIGVGTGIGIGVGIAMSELQHAGGAIFKALGGGPQH